MEVREGVAGGGEGCTVVVATIHEYDDVLTNYYIINQPTTLPSFHTSSALQLSVLEVPIN